jgi:hypothetical protein
MQVLKRDEFQASCDECERDVPAVIAVDGYAHPTWICLDCINKAKAMLEEEQTEE